MTTNAPATIRITARKPHPGQAKMLPLMKRFNVICGGRRVGKTAFALHRSLRPILSGKPVAYFSPTYKMMSEFWREAVELYHPVIQGANKSEHRFSVAGGGSFHMWSLDAADSIRGRKYALALIDEAAMVKDLEQSWNAVIRPTLTDYEGGADFYSTPKGLSYFHTLFDRGSDPNNAEWASFQMPTSANPFINPKEIEAARDELPTDIFRQEYLAEFIQGDGSVFRNITPNLYGGGDTPNDHPGHQMIAGVDWGQVNDFTVISVLCKQCSREVALDRFNKIDWHFQRERLKALFEAWGVTDAFVEVNSIGGPNFEELARTGLPVRAFQTTAQSKPEIIQSLALALEKNEIRLLDDPTATRELKAFEAKRSDKTGRISYGAPTGGHDDTVIARALANQLRWQGLGIW